jgi:hypothetical protein
MSLSQGGQLAPLKTVDPKDVLERYLAEESSESIAKSYGVTRAALSLFMLRSAESEWKDAQLTKALRRKENAEELMDRADNALDLTRAREQLRSAQWELERVCRRIYGQDAPSHAAQAVQININVRGAERQSSAAIEVMDTLVNKSPAQSGE